MYKTISKSIYVNEKKRGKKLININRRKTGILTHKFRYEKEQLD